LLLLLLLLLLLAPLLVAGQLLGEVSIIKCDCSISMLLLLVVVQLLFLFDRVVRDLTLPFLPFLLALH
jgi:hypothetical protein